MYGLKPVLVVRYYVYQIKFVRVTHEIIQFSMDSYHPLINTSWEKTKNYYITVKNEINKYAEPNQDKKNISYYVTFANAVPISLYIENCYI